MISNGSHQIYYAIVQCNLHLSSILFLLNWLCHFVNVLIFSLFSSYFCGVFKRGGIPIWSKINYFNLWHCCIHKICGKVDFIANLVLTELNSLVLRIRMQLVLWFYNVTNIFRNLLWLQWLCCDCRYTITWECM